MYVAPEHGRRGIGAALLRRVIETARTQGIEQLVLTVTDTNVPRARCTSGPAFARSASSRARSG
jgi:L-amino acid N-acyltransferase YncA